MCLTPALFSQVHSRLRQRQIGDDNMSEKAIGRPSGSPTLPENKMGVMPIPKLLFSMAVPAICSMILQAVYNIVDSIYVAQIGKKPWLPSLSYSLSKCSSSPSASAPVSVSTPSSPDVWGKRDSSEANSAASHGFILAIFNWLIFLIFTLVFSELFYTTFSDEPDLVGQAMDYSNVVTGVSCFVFVQMVCEKILQSTGNMIIPMTSNMAGCIVNIVLDPILIFGLLGFPAMGVKGAAIATVIGQLVGMTIICCFFFLKEHDVKVSFRKFRFSLKTIKDIYAVALPGMVMQAIPSVVNVFLNIILIGFSETAVSVLGVYFRIQSFVFMPVFGLNQGSTPIMGYNYGAKNKERLLKTLKLSLITAVCIMVVGFIIFQMFPSQIMSIFSESDEMMQMGTSAMRLLSLCFIPAAFGIVFSTLFQALGFGTYSLIMTLLRQFICVLPAAWFFSRFLDVTGVWISFPFAEIFSLTCAFYLFSRVYRRNIKPMPSPENHGTRAE